MVSTPGFAAPHASQMGGALPLIHVGYGGDNVKRGLKTLYACASPVKLNLSWAGWCLWNRPTEPADKGRGLYVRL